MHHVVEMSSEMHIAPCTTDVYKDYGTSIYMISGHLVFRTKAGIKKSRSGCIKKYILPCPTLLLLLTPWSRVLREKLTNKLCS